MDALLTGDFWAGLVKIVWINLLLSGDNAVVIALAARALAPRQQKRAIAWGSGAAVVLRILLTVFAAGMLELPFLKIIGGLLLLWIGVQLLAGEHATARQHGPQVRSDSGLLAAIRTILVADAIMSLDNVIGLAAAAEAAGREAKIPLLVLGLGVSIPIVIFGSSAVLALTRRWPIIVKLGGALLGWLAGEMAIADPAVSGWVAANADWMLEWKTAELAGAAIVVLLGVAVARRPPPQSSAPDAGGA